MSLFKKNIHSRPFIVTDASVYDIKPAAVKTPKDVNELLHAMQEAKSINQTITLRAGGTSLGGQAIGHGFIIDISKHFTKVVSVQPDLREAIVEPGVIQDDLNDLLRPMGLCFAPDTSTSNRAMIGGMIGNNSCGSYSVFYGTTRDHVKSVDVILSDKSEVTFGDLSPKELNGKLELPSLEGNIYRKVFALLKSKGELIVDSFPHPSIIRRNTGYALDALYAHHQPFNPNGKPFNLTPLICGSEGTLAVVKSARLNLEPLPKFKVLICAHFSSIQMALECMAGLMEFKPAAVEIIDKATLDCTKSNFEQSQNRFWIDADPEAVLVIELFDSSEKSLNVRAKDIQDWLYSQEAYAVPIIEQRDAVKVWSVRKAGLGLLMGKRSRKKAVAVIEDAAVPIVSLASYYSDVRMFMEELHVNCVYYGHASVGLIHIRPELDLTMTNDRELFQVIAYRHAEIVKKYRGAISGEHGDGRIRAPYIQGQVGDEVYQCLVDLKKAFDPDGFLNPGVIISDQIITQNLRADRKQHQSVQTGFSWEEDLGLLSAVEKCNGAGVCRKSSGRGVMCPSYQVTRDENFSTRGRSNLLRHALTEAKPHIAMADVELRQAMDLCLGCKACKSECPASVDMARLKSEFLYQTRSFANLASIMIKNYGRILYFSHRVPWLANYIQDIWVVKKLLGVDTRRKLPRIVSQGDSLQGWWSKNSLECSQVGAQKVWVLCDLYSQYTEPEVGRAVLQSLSKMGLDVHPLFLGSSPRALISLGLLNEAKHELKAVAAQLNLVKSADMVVGIEPSEVLVWRDEAKVLMTQKKIIGYDYNRVMLYEELILMLHDKRMLPEFKPINKRLILHVHCHQKSLASQEQSEMALNLIPGLEVDLLNTGCCGMSGDFGYKHYELSKSIAEQRLIPDISRMGADDLLVATGTSCRSQVADFTVRQGLHPAQVFLKAM